MTYNTGRTVTLDLDTLGNAAVWQVFQILTDNTGDTFYGNEEGASPAADADAACEVFLHIAETADARIKGYCDTAQRHFLESMKQEYMDIFETNPADDLRKRLADEEAATIITRTALSGHEYTSENIELTETTAERNCCPVSMVADESARELRVTGTAAAIEDFFAYCKEAAEEAKRAEEESALDKSETAALDAVRMYLGDGGNEPLREAIEVAAENCKRNAGDIFAAGRFEGAAAMLAAQIYATGADHGATRAQMIVAAYRAYGLPY